MKDSVVHKIPVWALTLAVMVLGGVSSIFTMRMYAPYFSALGLSTATTVVSIIFAGILLGFMLRVFVRVAYGLADRIFFRAMSAVPDYNLRRLPIPYNNYVRWLLLWSAVALALTCFFSGLLVFVFPLGVYLWRFLSQLAYVVCMGLAYRCMDKHFVPTWQSGKCFLSLAIPAGVIFIVFEVIL